MELILSIILTLTLAGFVWMLIWFVLGLLVTFLFVVAELAIAEIANKKRKKK